MKKNVCMFVWNHFTNDARVLRECTALSENGYHVDLICIHDPKDPNMPYVEKRNDRFTVYRIKRYPFVLTAAQGAVRFMKKNVLNMTVSAVFWLLLAYLFPLVVIPLTVLAAIVLKTRLKGLFIKGSLIARMTLKGYKQKYDVYHANDLNTLPQGYICAKWRIKQKKLIYDSHEVQTSRTGYHSPIYGKLEKFLTAHTDAMIVENHTRAKYNEDLYGFYPEVVHNYPFRTEETSVETVNLHRMLGLPEDEKILLYQGGIQTGRGLDKLIQAVPSFREGTLVLIGDGKIKPELEQMVSDMKLQNRVKFFPKVPLQELPKYTRTAYLGFQVLNNVCFNHYSASSNKLFEYMMAGVPVVACDFPEIKQVVEGNRTGLIVDSHDPRSIAKAVNTLTADPLLRDRLSKNSYQARNKYNWDEEQMNFLKVYKDSFGSKSALSETAV
ncbi:MAG: glycosyltransferase [Bacillus sp. (in: firmicutes)]